MVVDSTGVVHAVYGAKSPCDSDWGDEVRYASRAPAGGWTVSTVAAPAGSLSDLRLAPDDLPRVVYVPPTMDPVHAVRNATGWTTESIAVTPGARNALAVDSLGSSHLAHTSSSTGPDTALRYSTNAAGAWTDEIVAPAAAPSSGLAIVMGTGGAAHIAIARTGFVRVYSNTGGTWAFDEIDAAASAPGNDFRRASLAVDSGGHLHLAYLRPYGTFGIDDELVYATNEGGSWVISPLVSNVTDVELGVDAAGKVHLVYVKYQELHYASCP